jgi:hypothetical protein
MAGAESDSALQKCGTRSNSKLGGRLPRRPRNAAPRLRAVTDVVAQPVRRQRHHEHRQHQQKHNSPQHEIDGISLRVGRTLWNRRHGSLPPYHYDETSGQADA